MSKFSMLQLRAAEKRRDVPELEFARKLRLAPLFYFQASS